MTLRELKDNGTLLMLCKRGLLSTSVLAYFAYYDRYLLYKARGFTYIQSVYNTAEDFKVSVTTVKLAVSKVRE